MDIDVNNLTLGELETVEEIAGESAGALFRGQMSAKTIKAIVFVVRRRDDPEFTLEDAGDIKVVDLFNKGDDEVPPTESNA